MSNAREYRRILRAMDEALPRSDAIVLRALGRVRVERKADGSEVTAADRGAERALRAVLRAAFPGEFVVGEEYGGEIPAHGTGWIVDPIDGTASFALGLPTFGTLVARLQDGEPVFGAIHLPALGETTWAAVGHGCWFRRVGGRPRRVHVLAVDDLAAATVSLTGVHAAEFSAPGPWRLTPLLQAAGRVRFVTDCLQYPLVCRGLLDAAIDTRMQPWDIAALVPCVREAGGAVAPLGKERVPVLLGGSLVATGSPALLRTIQRMVRSR